jgi:integrase
MFPIAETSLDTIADYEHDAIKFVGQYARECEPDACDIPGERLVVLAVCWFLNTHGRWSESYIRRLANALHQRLARFVAMELIDDSPDPEKSLLWALKSNRPQSTEKTAKADKKSKEVAHQKRVAAKKKKRKKCRKSVRLQELRDLIDYFREKADGFSHWIAGYLLIASRIGWRPGEIVTLRREGYFLRAPAEKRSNGRGLADTCEVDISAYPEWIIAHVDQWIADTGKWGERYEGTWNLRVVMNARLATACKSLSIRRVSTYTLRHFAISCMKRSGFSRSEIAVLVNHATNRTASEKYGKSRSGIKRAKKMLRFEEARLDLVRDAARPYRPKIEAPPTSPAPP